MMDDDVMSLVSGGDTQQAFGDSATLQPQQQQQQTTNPFGNPRPSTVTSSSSSAVSPRSNPMMEQLASSEVFQSVVIEKINTEEEVSPPQAPASSIYSSGYPSSAYPPAASFSPAAAPPPPPPPPSATSFFAQPPERTRMKSIDTNDVVQQVSRSSLGGGSSSSSSSNNSSVVVVGKSSRPAGPDSSDSDFLPSPYLSVSVLDPHEVKTPGLFGEKYWSYPLSVSLSDPLAHPRVLRVTRRFRDVVALESRVRRDCPGCVLPPPPSRHQSRVLTDMSVAQSSEFARARSATLGTYLQSLASHPALCSSPSLRTFLTLSDDVGNAWPEVSASVITRGLALASSAASAAPSLVSSATGHHISGLGGIDASSSAEDDDHLASLTRAEIERLAALGSAAPKLAGAAVLLREHGEAAGSAGMEITALSRGAAAASSAKGGGGGGVVVGGGQQQTGRELQALAEGLLRSGRRARRAAVEVGAALEPFLEAERLGASIRCAMHDRKEALGRRASSQRAIAGRALFLQQAREAAAKGGGDPNAEKMVKRGEEELNDANAAARDAVAAAAKVGRLLAWEVNRLEGERRKKYAEGLKIMASAFKEACGEKVAIWEAAREAVMNGEEFARERLSSS